MEYMALRKPTVCFRTRENQITAGDSAIYADNNDIASFASAIVKLMDDPALRNEMGLVARSRIDDGFTWNHQAGELVNLYNDLFGRVCSTAPRAAASDEQHLERQLEHSGPPSQSFPLGKR